MSSDEILPVKLANGEFLKCGACGRGEFESRSALLDTRAASFFGMDWTDRSATCYVCAECGHLEWFLRPARKPEPLTRRRSD